MNCHIIRIQRGGVRNREREWNGCVASRRRKASGCARMQLHWLRCCCAQQLIGHICCAASSHCAAAFNTCHAEFSFRRLRATLLAMLLWSIHGVKVTESEATLSLVCNYPWLIFASFFTGPHLNCIDKKWQNHKSTTSFFKKNEAKSSNAQLIWETRLKPYLKSCDNVDVLVFTTNHETVPYPAQGW